MSQGMLWVAVLASAAGCMAFKLLGLSIPHGVLDRPTVRRIAALLPVALLAALVGIQTFAAGTTVVIDARVAGFAVAVTALLLRAPFLVVVFLAAATTALLRLVF
jgi:hypothetical protein